jgi:phosphinothricin acetyltransferase
LGVLIRPTEIGDLEGICEILNHEIREGVAHFGYHEQAPDDLRREFETRGRHVWLSAERQGEIAGFARSVRWKTREAYQWTAELGVYVGSRHQGEGVGTALYRSLIPALAAAGFRSVVAGIALPNPASVRLHERLGMTHIGTFPQMGWKKNAWHDVGYWSLVLSPEAPSSCT